MSIAQQIAQNNLPMHIMWTCCHTVAVFNLVHASPMGLMSAELQSYFVRYPRSPSSTFAEPSTSRKPLRFRVQGRSCAAVHSDWTLVHIRHYIHIEARLRILTDAQQCPQQSRHDQPNQPLSKGPVRV